MTSSFQRASVSGLPDGARDDALYHDEIEEEEKGLWHYLVVDKDGAVPRYVASYDKSHVADGKYDDGMIVAVTKRIRRGWTHWLGLRDKAEWLFDVDPADKTLVMMEVTVQDGVQDACAAETMQILPRAMFDAPSKNTLGNIESGEGYKIVQRVSLLGGLGTFQQISNGRGWVMEPQMTLEHAQHHGGLRLEHGSWDYMALDTLVVVVPHVGAEPSAVSQVTAQSTGYEEGSIVQVTERVLGDRTRLLKTQNGWARETLFEKKSKPRRIMMEIPVERGSFAYRVLIDKGVAIRSRCSFAENAKISTGPLGGEIVQCNERVRCGETTFVRMTDGRGWLFDVKNGKHVLEVVEEKLDNGALGGMLHGAQGANDDALDLGEGFVLDMKTPRPPGT